MSNFILSNKKLIQAILIFIVAVTGVIYIRFTWIKIEDEEKNNVLQIAKSVEVLLPKGDIKKLTAKEDDIEKNEYKTVKNALKDIIRINNTARFAYLYTMQNGKIFFIADSEPETSKDYSPPGQEYVEAKPQDKKPFYDGKELVTSPLTDRWGKWISVLIPIKDETTGKVIAVFGIDFDAKRWDNIILYEVIESSLMIILILLLVLFSLRIKAKNNSLKSEILERMKAEERIQRQTNRFNAILNTLPDLLFVIDSKGFYRDCYAGNPGKLLLPADKIIGMNLKEVFGEEKSTRHLQKINECILFQKLITYEYSIEFDGSFSFFEARLTPLDKDSILTTVRDVTVQRQAENNLRDSERLLNESQHVSRIGSYTLDIRSGIWKGSAVFDKMVGLTDTDIHTIQESISAIHTDDRQRIMNYFGRVISEKGSLFDKDFRIVGKNSSEIRWMHCIGEIEFDENGNAVKMIGTVQDITESKLMQEEINYLSLLQHLLMKLGTQFINLSGNDFGREIKKALAELGEFTNVDRVYIFDYDFERDIMCNTYEWCAEGILPEIDNLKEIPNGMFPDWVHAHKNGNSVYIPSVSNLSESSNLRAILSAQGIQSLITIPLNYEETCLGFIGFDSVRRERNWLESEQNLLKLFGEMLTNLNVKTQYETLLQQEKIKAESSDKLKTAFLNNISHEVRTPLSGILGFGQYMADPNLSQEEKELYLRILNTSGHRLLNTITGIMDISLIASGSMKVQKKTFKLKQLFEEIYSDFRKQCSEKNLSLSLCVQEEQNDLEIYSDFTLLKKTLSHILDNAVKFTNQGEITFGCTGNCHTAQPRTGFGIVSESLVASNLLRFFVKDTGVDIGSTAQISIFENFMQEDVSMSRGHEGSGLGLSIAKGIVELLGGEIRVESVKGEGSTFSFTLPAISSEAISSEETSLNDTALKHSILIAEDDEISYRLMEAILKKTSTNLLRAFTGKTAVELVLEHPEISLVLMDLKMPGMNGLEAAKEIKSFRQNLPIIAVTAHAETGAEHLALSSGCDDYIVKPFNRDKLMALIQKWIGII